MKVSKELMAASAVPLILSLLSRTDAYGYELMRRIEEVSGERLHWRPGMIYQVLHRLRRKGWIESRRSQNPNGPDRIYYRLTPRGTRALAEELEPWLLIYLTLKKINPRHLRAE